MTAALGAITEPGDVVVTESITYPGLRRLADFLRIRLHGVPDGWRRRRSRCVRGGLHQSAAQGVLLRGQHAQPDRHRRLGRTAPCPGARSRAVTASRSSKTTSTASCWARATSSRSRRMRRNSATISPASRSRWRRACASAISPSPKAPSISFAQVVRSTTWMAAPLTAEIAADWVEDGTGMDLAEAHRIEAIARQRMARRILNDRTEICGDESSYHIWLRLPGGLDRGRLCAAGAPQGRRRIAGHHLLADAQCAQRRAPVPLCTGRPAGAGNGAAAYRRDSADAARLAPAYGIV